VIVLAIKMRILKGSFDFDHDDDDDMTIPLLDLVVALSLLYTNSQVSDGTI
jgi:hypothetical protein